MRTRIPIFSLLAALGATQGLAAENRSAQDLYDKNCVACHGPEMYTRVDRRVDSLAKLDSQVRWCANNLELLWFDEDITAVTRLLNDRFYHFKP